MSKAGDSSLPEVSPSMLTVGVEQITRCPWYRLGVGPCLSTSFLGDCSTINLLLSFLLILRCTVSFFSVSSVPPFVNIFSSVLLTLFLFEKFKKFFTYTGHPFTKSLLYSLLLRLFHPTSDRPKCTVLVTVNTSVCSCTPVLLLGRGFTGEGV